MRMKKLIVSLLFIVLVGFCLNGNEAKASDTATVEKVMNVKCQVTAGTDENTTTAVNMRLVTSIDSLDYKEVGFKIYYNGAKNPVIAKTSTVYERIVASAESGVDYNYNPKIVSTDSEYFVTCTLIDIARGNFDNKFYIKPYAVTMDDETVYGVSRYVKVSDSYNDVINLPVKVTAEQANGMQVAIDDNNKAKLTQGAGYEHDGTYAHLTFTVNEGQALSSVTKFTIKDSEGSEITTAYHRNPLTKYTGGTTYDRSWYDANTSADGFVITTLADLYGFAEVSKTYTFSEKTVYLGTDIIVNEGNPKDNGWDATNGPTNKWTDYIGPSVEMAFQGTFDGQGQRISGVYASGTTNVGLFGYAHPNSVITNFKLENSYFYGSGDYVASIVSRGNGTVSKIYSAAIVEGNGGNLSGLVAYMNGDYGAGNGLHDRVISDCWFNGEVTLKNSSSHNVGGFLASVSSSEITIMIEHCLFNGTLNNTVSTTGGGRVGGFVGCFNGSETTVIISDCLSAGTINNKGNKTGSFVAYSWAPLTIQNSYAVYESCLSGTTHISVEGGTHTGVTPIEGENLYGTKGYSNTNLQFDNSSTTDTFDGYWTAREGRIPALRSFVAKEAQMPLDTQLRKIDTSWYNTIDIVFTITTKEQLYGFAELTKTDTFSGKTVKLGADIVVNEGNPRDEGWNSTTGPTNQWNSYIGPNVDYAFQGTFDGQGHRISGVYASGTSFVGLFGYAHPNSVITNFRLENSYFYGTGDHVASIVGRGNGTISNVYSSATVESNSGSLGGIVGQMNGDYGVGSGLYDRTISNCWFDGTITLKNSEAYHVGGFLGSKTSVVTDFKDCLFTGTINNTVSNTHGGRVGGFVGGINGGTTNFYDCLSAGTLNMACDNRGSYVGYNGATVTFNNVYAVTESCLSGSTHLAVAGAANSSVKTFSKTNMTGAEGYRNVILSYDKNATADVEEGQWIIRKNDVPALKTFVKADDIYDITGLFHADSRWYTSPSYAEEDGTKVYVVSTIEEMMGISTLVNEGKNFSGEKIVLDKDITMYTGDYTTWGTTAPGNVSWTPIGKDSTYYFAGTFDGQGHTISGIYCNGGNTQGVALFGYLHPNSLIQNLKLKDSYFTSTADYAGSIAGWGLGSILNVYSNAYVSGSGSCGGIVGYISNAFYQARSDEKISNCWFDGNVTISTINAGGIIGKVRYSNTSITIEHCYNSGNIHSDASANGRASGFVGDMQTDCTVIIRDSLTVGNLTGTQVGKIVGCIEGASVADVGTDSTYAIRGDYKGANMVGGGSLKTGTEAIALTLEELTGYNACNNTKLDFYLDGDNVAYWTVRSDGTPILTTFAEEGLYVLDTSWYDGGTTTVATYELDSMADLYGFAMLSTKDNFEGDTIVVASEIETLTVNEEQASTYKTTAPRYEWIPIGGLNNSNTFKGNFNGNGVIISGIYCNVSTNHTGLFAGTNGCSIQDFRLENSYFATTKNYAGSISSYTVNSTLSNIYSNAIVDCVGTPMGGLLGFADGSSTTTTINNCWFNGAVNDTVPTDNDNYSMAGGLVGKLAVNVTLNVTNSLNSGTVSGARRVGGLVGDSNYNAIMNFTNCMNTGEINATETVYATVNQKGSVTSSIGTAGYPAGSLVGYVSKAPDGGTGNPTSVTFNNTFAVNDDTTFAIGNNVISVYSDLITGEATMSARSALLGYTELINSGSGVWVLNEVDGKLSAGLAQFVPESERVSDTELKELLALATLNKSLSDAVDKGDANYVITLNDSSNLYQSYVAELQKNGRGFTLEKDNSGTVLNSEGTYNAVLTKDEWVISVTHVGNKVNKTYVTINCAGQDVSPHLKGNMEYGTKVGAKVEGYTAATDLNVSFHMTQKCWKYGNGFVIQLKNGHFIVIDGGVEQELPYLLDYMDSLCKEGTVPIVEAWVISHVHRDHLGALIELIKYSKEGYADQGSSGTDTYYGGRLYVEGIYYSEAAHNLVKKEYAESASCWAHKYQYNTIIEQASNYLKSTDGTGTKVYRPQAGQRYYFDGVMMDIILTQEQLDITPGETDTNIQTINDTSTWCMFTMDAGNNKTKTVLSGGDGYERSMKYLVNAFATNTTYFRVDVMTALHHGENGNTDFMKLCKVNTVVLFDMYVQYDINNYYKSLYNNAAQGSKVSGDGNVALTFKSGNITISQTKRTNWPYCDCTY